MRLEDGRLALRGHGSPFDGKPGQIRITFVLSLRNEGGKVLGDGSALAVGRADAVTLLVMAGTDFVNCQDVSGDADARARRDLDDAGAKPFAELRRRHLGDYRALFRRVALDLGGASAQAALPTDQRIREFDGGDRALAAMYFQFGRYLGRSRLPGRHPPDPEGRL